MAKDYAKRAPKKKSESKTRRKGSKGGSQVFGFFRMLKGLCLLSLIMMSGFYLSHQFGERLSAWLFPEETSSEHARALNGHETQFEFYNILPKKQASQVVDKSQQSALALSNVHFKTLPQISDLNIFWYNLSRLASGFGLCAA